MGQFKQQVVDYKVQSSIWQMIHRNFFSGYKKMYRNDGKCKLCKTIESKRTHIFMDCIITKQILDQFTDFL